jgi:hypothetical protein
MKAVTKMTKEQLASELERVSAAVTDLREQHDKIEKALNTKWNRQKALEKQLLQLDYEAKAAQGVTDWAKLLEVTPGETSYEFLQKEILKRAPLHSITNSGYYPETMQYCLQLRLTKNNAEQIAEAKALIDEIMPALKPLENGLIRFDILESTCSYHASYAMAYDTSTKQWYAGAESRISRNPHFGNTFATLEEALIYVSKNCWASSYDDDDKESDDDY